MILYGRHVAMAALLSGRRITRLYLQMELKGPEIGKFIRESGQRKIPLEKIDRRSLDALCAAPDHQGVALKTAEYTPLDSAELETLVAEKKIPGFVFLDGIQDPGNLGGILRAAVAFNLVDVVLPKNRACPVTAAVFKASAGAIEKARVYQVANLATLARKLKNLGAWFYGADAHARKSLTATTFNPPAGLVIGAEHDGIGHSLQKELDDRFVIPLENGIESLNANQSFSILAHTFHSRGLETAS